MAMMMEPPTASPSTIEMALAASRISTRGLAKKPRNASRAAKRDSAARLLGPWRRNRCFASAEVSPAGAALSRSSRSRSGISQKRSRVLFGVFMRSLSGESRVLSEPWHPRAQGCGAGRGLQCTASANCLGIGSLAAAGSLTCSKRPGFTADSAPVPVELPWGQDGRGALRVRRVGNPPVAPVNARTLWVARSLTSCPTKAHSSLWARDCSHASRRSKKMLWTICVVLLVLWALGMATSYTASGLIHILLVLALVVMVIRLFQGRSVV